MLEEILDYLNNLPPLTFPATLLAAIVAAIRVVYDDKETKPMRILLEASLCGFLTLAVGHAILALGLDLNWILFSGGFIGFIGSSTTRTLALKLFDNKVKNK